MRRFAPVPASLALALVPVASALACSPAPDAPRPNLLLVSIDTLRADHLGLYGYERPTSPRLDELAAESVVFENAYSHVSWTLPSLASVMTSLYPATHACWNFESRLDGSFTTLAERLAAAGYDTAGVGSHVFLDAKRGLQQGFAEYDDELVLKGMGQSHAAISSQPVTRKALRMLERRAKRSADGPRRPWFLWVHYFDPHDVYQPHPELSDRFGAERDVDLYDGEIAYTDDAIGRLLTQLAKLGFAEETVVAVLSDHGEEFGDHGGRHHGSTLYREVVRVPLLVRAPGFAPRRVTEAVRLVDVQPTLLELLGVDPGPDPGFEGRSLVPAMRGEPLGELPIVGELRLREPGLLDSLQRGRWKLIVDRHKGRTLLFDVEADPLEQHDLAAERPEVAARLAGELERTLAAAREKAAAFGAPGAVDLSPEELEELRELGYVGERGGDE